MDDWFEEWFNTPLYENLYSHRNEQEAIRLIDFLIEEMPVQQYKNVLDLGCGRGRHSLTLAERGYHVCGVDLSERAIEKAKIEAKKRELSHVEFQVMDMRNQLNKTFDAIVNLFTTFGYFLEDDENKKVLHNVSQMLNSNGLYIMDFLNETVVKNELVSSGQGSYGKIDYRIEREIRDNMAFKTIRFSGEQFKDPVEYTERVKLYDIDWFTDAFKEAGLQLRKTAGNYNGDSYNREKSPRLIMICDKIK